MVPLFALSKLTIAGIILLLCLARSGEGRELTFKDILENHSDEITFVIKCGHWKSDQMSGYYRIIVTEFLYGGTRLWVQWMADRDSEGRTRSVYTLSFKEINDDHVELIFDEPQCDQAASGIVLRFNAEDGHDSQMYDVEITISERYGDYKIDRQAMSGVLSSARTCAPQK